MKGIYALLISVTEKIRVHVGALGDIDFEEGLYVYVGSAQNNLEKRVERHLRKVKPRFWHIDYLLSSRQVHVVKTYYKKAGRIQECKLAKGLSEVATPITSFGSSDCTCDSHLFKVESYDYLSEFMREIEMKPLREMLSMAKTGWCAWVTGLPGSGKSTVAEALIGLLKGEGVHAQLLSSDALRKVVTPKPSYSLRERDIVYATLVYVADLLTRNGVNVVIDATGNLRRYRENARTKIPAFVEIYLECPLRICKEREAGRVKTHHAPMRIYDRAIEGKAQNVPGMGQPYEPPLSPELTIDTTRCSPPECARKALEKILRFEAGANNNGHLLSSDGV
jgi:adenylylsulfate kinase